MKIWKAKKKEEIDEFMDELTENDESRWVLRFCVDFFEWMMHLFFPNTDTNKENSFSQEAKVARNEYNAVNREIKNLEEEMQKLDEVLTIDFGDKNIFAALFDECYSTKIGKYDYEFCPFAEVKQKEGHSSTDLGKFKSFGYEDESGELRMIFEDGQKCWNGPKRSTNVLFECDVENKIVSVNEPSTCKYAMTFKTPLACKQNELDSVNQLIANQYKTDL